MDKKYVVYIHTSPSNKKYVGITSQDPKRRWANGLGYANNFYFTSAIKKYGWDNFKHEIIYDDLSKEEAEKMEVELIARYNTCDRSFGYNLTTGGETNKQYSEDTINKMIINNTGENNPFYGKNHTYETKKLMSILATGKKRSEETRMRISESKKGTQSGENNGMFGKTHSEESKNKMSEKHKGKSPSKKAIQNSVLNRSRRIVQLDNDYKLINSYEQIKTAAEYMNVSSSAIRESCVKNGKIKIKNYRWMYIEDYNKYINEKEIN